MNRRAAITMLVVALTMIGTVSVSAAPLYEDDFSDGNHTANPSWTPNAGNWTVNSGVLHQNDFSTTFVNGTQLVLGLDGFASDGPYTLEADMGLQFSQGNNSVGFAYHVQDPLNMNVAVFFPGYPGGALRIIRIVNGNGTIISGGGNDLHMGFTPAAGSLVFHTMRLEVDGPDITVSVHDGVNTGQPFTYIGTFSDPTFAGGGVGFVSQGAQGFYDNFTLVVPEPASAGLLAVGLLALARRRR